MGRWLPSVLPRGLLHTFSSALLTLALPLALGAIVAVCATPVRADWIPNGNPVLSVPLGEAQGSRLVADGAGGIYVTWRQSGLATVQHLTHAGDVASGWPGDGLSGWEGYPEEYSPAPAPDGSGGVYVVWLDRRFRSVAESPAYEGCQLYVQRYTADGRIAPGWPHAGVIVEERIIAYEGFWATAGHIIALPDGSGGLIVGWSWTAFLGPTGIDLFAQRIAPNGARQWGDNGVAVCAAAGNQLFPAAVPDGHGGAIFVWGDERPPGPGGRFYAQRLSGAGRALWRQEGVAVSARSFLRFDRPQVVPDDAGGAILAWSGVSDSSDIIEATGITRDGRLSWREGVPLCRAAGERSGLQLAATHDGGGACGGARTACSSVRPPGGEGILRSPATGTAAALSPGATLAPRASCSRCVSPGKGRPHEDGPKAALS